MTGHHAAWKGHLGGQEVSGPGKVHKQLRKTVKCDVSYSAKPFAEVSPGIIDVMKMTLVENSPGMSSTKCTYSNSLRCHSQWIDSVEICDLVWALGHLVSSPYRPQAFLKTFGLDAIKKENALVLSLWKVNWTCKNSIQGLSIVMCIVDQVPLSAFTKSTRLQAQKWGQPWDFLSTDSKWSSSQASYSSSMETHSLESSRSSDVTRDSGITTHPHGPTKLVDSLQELGGLPNRQDGLGDLSEEWSATSLDSLDVWRLKGFGWIWIVKSCESIHFSIYLIYLFVWESINLSLNWSHCPLDVENRSIHTLIPWCIHTRMLWSPLGCFTYSACTDASLHSCIMQSGKVSIASHIFWSKDLFCINSCLPISMFDQQAPFSHVWAPAATKATFFLLCIASFCLVVGMCRLLMPTGSMNKTYRYEGLTWRILMKDDNLREGQSDWGSFGRSW